MPASVRDIASGQHDPGDAVAAALARIDQGEPDIHAWVHLDRDGALAAARALDHRAGGPLCGVPFGVKDIIDVQGLRTECGSVLRRGAVAEKDAALVAMLRAAGAVPIGKTVTTEFAYFAPGPTHNPRAPGHTPGGSSSGSAAAVAAGMVPFALGSQTAGSLTRPAAYCGVAGFVPPVGTLSTEGINGLAETLDAPGLLAGSVEDLRLVYSALRPRERSVEVPERPRIAIWSGAELGPIEIPMQAALAHAAEDLAASGAAIEPLGWSGRTAVLAHAHGTVMAFEACRALSVEAGHPDQLSTPLNDLLTHGRALTRTEYDHALAAAAEGRAAAEDLFTTADVILGPAALGVAPPGLSATGSPVLSRPWQLLGLPVVTVAGYRDPTGLPLGLQLIGHPDRVPTLFALARMVEDAAQTIGKP